MNVGTIFLFVSLFLISPFSRASIEILSHSVQTYKPEKEASSPLKSFRLEVLKKKVVLKFDPNNPSFQTDVKMIVETQEISSVEDFAIVQFIKGCIYKSKSINGELRKEISSYRKHQGEFKPFIHKEFEVDADGADPVYTDLDGDRFGLYRVGSLDPGKSSWYRQASLRKPLVYATDLPGQATTFETFDGKLEAQNPSLDFKTCLFKSDDLTFDMTQGNLDISKALTCFDWAHRFSYDFKKKKFEEVQQIDPICLN